MRVGIAYDLKSDYIAEGYSEEEAAEFDSEETIAGIENALKANGYKTERIGNVRSLLSLLHNGKRWDIVFNICEGINGIGREAQVPAVLDIFNIPYTFSDVLVNSLTLHKGLTKRVIRDLGIPQPILQSLKLPPILIRSICLSLFLQNLLPKEQEKELTHIPGSQKLKS